MKTSVRETWSASNVDQAKYIGTLLSGGDSDEEFEVLSLPDRLVFGGSSNAGFLESGYIKREEGEDDDDLLIELADELETYYRDGLGSTNRIVHNERM